VSCFLEFTEKPIPPEKRVEAGRQSYREAWENEFSQARDISHIYGEENIFRYLPLTNTGFRIQESDSLEDVELALTAAHTAHTPLTLSVSETNPRLEAIRKIAAAFPTTSVTVQEETDFAADMHRYERIRACSTGLSDATYQKAAELGKYIADAKPLVEGRLELLHYLKEQSIAREYHRYGSIFEN
jgi:RHH-type proline utilization regulon transcriptional repressor/proline dehydrogenase/delta 1-pyrroline-5-carboxylate dehydrogenase